MDNSKAKSNYRGYNGKPSSQNFFFRFSFVNSIANISLYTLSCLKFNLGYYFTFEIGFLGFQTREFCLFDELQDLTDSAIGIFCRFLLLFFTSNIKKIWLLDFLFLPLINESAFNANISLYPSSCPKLNFGYYLTFEIIIKV